MASTEQLKPTERMRRDEAPKRFGEHRNSFGFLRLLFASLVIVSHVPEVVDNDPHREILHRLTGTMTFGGFAVLGFFVISGYLITGSLLSSRSLWAYFAKRIARIYPGFIGASVICLLLVAPLAGAKLDHSLPHTIAADAAHMLILGRPMAEHAFIGQHFNDRGAALDGALWTIQYEFTCYALIALLSLFGLVRFWPVVVLSLVLLITSACLPDGTWPWLSHDSLFPGKPASLFQLSGMFLSGAAWYLCRNRVGFTPVRLGFAAVALAAALRSTLTAYLGFALVGAYLIFGVAKLGAGTWLERINNRTDISYGVYVYAWPAEQLLIRFTGIGASASTVSLVFLGMGVWLIALGCGWLSWTIIERPALELMRKRLARPTAR